MSPQSTLPFLELAPAPLRSSPPPHTNSHRGLIAESFCWIAVMVGWWLLCFQSSRQPDWGCDGENGSRRGEAHADSSRTLADVSILPNFSLLPSIVPTSLATCGLHRFVCGCAVLLPTEYLLGFPGSVYPDGTLVCHPILLEDIRVGQ